MNFFIWYGIGLFTILALFSVQAYSESRSIKVAADEVYDILIRKADLISNGLLLAVAWLGPLLILAIAYFQFRAWQDGLAVDEDGNRDYPWSDD